MIIKEVVRIVDQYDNTDKIEDEVKQHIAETYSLLGHEPMSIDEDPVKGLPYAEDVIALYEKGDLTGEQTYYCLARVKDLWADPTYNRVLDIRFGNCKRYVESRQGFAPKAADSLSVFLRPSLKMVTTKGNHRATMRYMCGLNPDARIVVALRPHSPSTSLEEMIRVESEDHHYDASMRSNQGGDDKFKSAYYSEQAWALELFSYLEVFRIGIAGTLEDADFSTTSHKCVSTALKLAHKDATSKYLATFTELNINPEVLGNTLVAGAIFLNVFREFIEEIDRINGVDSFKTMMDFFFLKRKENALKAIELGRDAGIEMDIEVEDDVRQQDIVKGNGLFKSNEIAVCRFISLYNKFCAQKNYKHNLTYNTAIPISKNSEVFAAYVKEVDPILRNNLEQVAKDPVATG